MQTVVLLLRFKKQVYFIFHVRFVFTTMFLTAKVHNTHTHTQATLGRWHFAVFSLAIVGLPLENARRRIGRIKSLIFNQDRRGSDSMRCSKRVALTPHACGVSEPIVCNLIRSVLMLLLVCWDCSLLLPVTTETPNLSFPAPCDTVADCVGACSYVCMCDYSHIVLAFLLECRRRCNMQRCAQWEHPYSLSAASLVLFVVLTPWICDLFCLYASFLHVVNIPSSPARPDGHFLWATPLQLLCDCFISLLFCSSELKELHSGWGKPIRGGSTELWLLMQDVV